MQKPIPNCPKKHLLTTNPTLEQYLNLTVVCTFQSASSLTIPSHALFKVENSTLYHGSSKKSHPHTMILHLAKVTMWFLVFWHPNLLLAIKNPLLCPYQLPETPKTKRDQSSWYSDSQISNGRLTFSSSTRASSDSGNSFQVP